MRSTTLGSQGMSTSALGLGCMGMSQWYGATDERESLRALRVAHESGYRMFDTAEAYGPHTNERLLGVGLGGVRAEVTIATKFGFPTIGPGGRPGVPDSRPEHIRECVDGSLRRLDTDYIDLLYQHRMDPRVPVEDVVGEMATLVNEGKVRYIGLCEVGATTIRRAHAVHPLTAVQAEYSLWERNVESDVLPTLRELGIGFVAFSPLGRGFLAGESRGASEFDHDDFRRMDPRFRDANINTNVAARKGLEEVAEQVGASTSQLAIAWLIRQGVVPIPGTRREARVRENAQAAALDLTDDMLDTLDTLFPAVAGDRYEAAMMEFIDR